MFDYPVKLRESGYFTGFAGKLGFVLQGKKFEAIGKELDVWAGGPGQTHYTTASNEGIARYADQYSHGFGDKVIPYEEGSKAPLLIYDPRLSKNHAGQVCDAVTGNVDLSSTIFALSGISAPEGIDCKNLLPLLTNPASQVREFLPLSISGVP